jgi:hypothetical protein
VIGVSCFPGSCHFRGSRGRVKDRAEPGRRGGAGGVLETAGRRATIIGAAGEQEPGYAGYEVVRVRPSPGLPVRQCRWLQSSLRVSPAVAVAGAAWGGPRQSRRSGGIIQVRAPAAGGGGQTWLSSAARSDPRRSKKASRVLRSRPGAAQISIPVSWSTR